MRGRVCMVTGANRGIGMAMALGLARTGATVVMVCRDRERGEDALAGVRRGSGNDSVELLLADLSSLESIRDAAAEVAQRFSALHVLVNNAGVYRGERRLSADGFELTFAVNHLNYFVLTHCLLDLLQHSAPARIVNVASQAHTSARLDLDNLQGETGFSGGMAYSNSKLANILFTYELARRLEDTGVTANCLHPGVISTGLADDFVRDMNPLVRLLRPLVKLFLASPEKGARTGVYLASSPDVDGVSGKYFVDCRETRSSAASYDQELAARLWEISCTLSGIDSYGADGAGAPNGSVG